MSTRRPSRLVACIVALAAVLAGCSEPPRTYQGWVEADLIFVAPDETGRLETLSAKEGDKVRAGEPLFTLENDLYSAEVRLNQAQVENALQAFNRAQVLLRNQAGTQKTYDDAEASLRTARARLNTAQTRLERRKVASPVTGTVQQVYFRPGEMVSSGRPVLSILPPGNLKLRFFVPEAVLPRISYGETVYVHCDGCADGITARVNFISRSAEYTPPVIYSLQERAKLVFLIEALPNDPGELRVGQPVDISLVPPAAPQAAGETKAPADSEVSGTSAALGSKAGGKIAAAPPKASSGPARVQKGHPIKLPPERMRPTLPRPGGPPL